MENLFLWDGIWEYKAGTGWVKETYFTGTNLTDGFIGIGNFGDYQVNSLPPKDYPEIVVISNGTARIQNLNGTIIFGPYDLPFFPPANNKGFGGQPTVGDFDGDGKVEFAVAGRGSFTVFDMDCQKKSDGNIPFGCYADGILWTIPSQDISSSVTGSSLFDFEGDGKFEVIYADECFARIYDGTTGEVLFSQPRKSGTWYENPIVADVDHDFRAEFVFGSNNNCNISCPELDPVFKGLKCSKSSDCPTSGSTCVAGYCRCSTDLDCGTDYKFKCVDPIINTPGKGKVCRSFHDKNSDDLYGLFVYSDIQDNWVGSRYIWNQHVYFVTNVYDTGVIPKGGQWAYNWENETLNHFKANIQGDLHPTAAADLTVMPLYITNCSEKGEITVSVLVCNRGIEGVGAGLYVAFFEGNPDEKGVVKCLKKTDKDILSGECINISCDFSKSDFEEDIYVIADFGYDIGMVKECFELNNKAKFEKVTCFNLP